MGVTKLVHLVAWCFALAAVIFGGLSLESERLTVFQSTLSSPQGEVTIYQHTSGSSGPLIVVAHGFAGSQQMMQYLSRDLARAGYIVAAFDFYGHGRNTQLLSPDVTRIEGTTQQLVAQTKAITKDVREHLGLEHAEYALLGHSMATDIIIRAAEGSPKVTSIVAISMYSDVVTSSFPQNLLILSGEWEGRLREVGLRLVAQVDPAATEGKTVSNGVVTRRTDYVPYTEHVAVLYSRVTLGAVRDWFDQTLAAVRQDAAPVGGQGVALISLLGGFIALFVLSVHALPRRDCYQLPPNPRRFIVALVVPALCALGAAAVGPSAIFGIAGFGTLAWFLMVWGAVQLACIGRAQMDLARPKVTGFLLLAVIGGAVFALALDRYAAAFVPSGIRWSLMAVLLPATVLFACADRMLVCKAPVWRRLASRMAALATLGIAMVLIDEFGLLFTAVPVLALFYLVYGTMGHAIAMRYGPLTAGPALGVILAWAIAASTPLFAVDGTDISVLQ